MRNQKQLVSVIMNCYNGEKFIKKSVYSIISQSYKKWELVFWDNNSSDNSKNILKEFKDKRIKYFYSKKFNTLYKSRNLAIKKAKGKYICFLDVDDSWKKNRLKDQVLNLEKFGKNLNYSNYEIKNKINNETILRKKGNLPNGLITQSLLDDYFIGIISVTINKKIFKNYKFNEKYNVIGDFDLFLRLSLKYEFNSITKVLSTYNVHGKNFSDKNLGMYIVEMKHWLNKNEKLFLKDYNINKLKFFLLRLQVKNFFKNLKFLGV